MATLTSITYARGLWYGVGAYAIWGLSPIFWKALDHVPSPEVLANRVVWAVPTLAIVILWRRRLRVLRAAAARRRTVLVAVAAAGLVSVNWGLFIWSVATDQIVEASLGYFINPLLSVALGVAVLGERLRPAQMVAVSLAAAGVLYMTVRLGRLPWISLVLATTFALYGLLKKHGDAAPALEGLLLETASVGVPAAIWIVVLTASGDAALVSGGSTTALLLASGAFTAAPLLLFGAAAQRIPLATIGVLQYLTPTLQFLLGVLAYGEAVTVDQMIGFAFVWAGLAVFTSDNVRRAQAAGTAVPAA